MSPVPPAEGIASEMRNGTGSQIVTNVPNATNTESDQPDAEPEVPSIPSSQHSDESPHVNHPEPNYYIDVPVPATSDDDGSETENTDLFMQDEPLYHLEAEQAFKFEVDISQKDTEHWREEPRPAEMSFLVSAAKRQRSEGKISHLTASERSLFDEAKTKEIGCPEIKYCDVGGCSHGSPLRKTVPNRNNTMCAKQKRA